MFQSTGSRHTGFSTCSMRVWSLWLSGSRAQAQYLWATGLVAPWHVRSSQIRDQTHIPCLGRWILIHCTFREVLPFHSVKHIHDYGMQPSPPSSPNFSLSLNGNSVPSRLFNPIPIPLPTTIAWAPSSLPVYMNLMTLVAHRSGITEYVSFCD